MNQRNILSALVIIFFISSILSVVSLFYAVNKTTISGKASEGTVSIVINNICGNNICVENENCSDDATNCTDTKCYEPTCTNGCGQSAVANGQTDEACTGSTGCTGTDCKCDGSGNCLEGGISPSPGGPTGGASGGGGSSISDTKPRLIIEPEKIKLISKINEPFKKDITLKNLMSRELRVRLELVGVDKITALSKRLVAIPPKSEVSLTLEGLSNVIKVYTGSLNAYVEGQLTNRVPIIIEIESEEVLFDLSLDIKPKLITREENELTALTTIFSITRIDSPVDITLNYFIKDLEDNVILQDEEIIVMEEQATTSKIFKIPEDVIDGEYVFIVQAQYKNSVGTATESFTINRAIPSIEQPIKAYQRYNLLILIIIALVLILIFILNKKLKQVTKLENKRISIIKDKKIRKRDIMENLLAKQKLQKQREVLQRALKEGFISKESYKQDNENIEKALKKLK